ncbi:MAG: phage tail protein [Oscillospiraceae bacterium]|nr:phage tail protein [Oscillospiraceae bacterium]
MLEKAKIILYGEGAPKTVPVLFNPENYDLSRSVNYAKLSVPGLNNPILQFINGQETTLTLTLHFDTLNDFVPKGADEDVRAYTAPILNALRIDGALHAPPTAAFFWGSFSFAGVITNAKQSFTMFLPSGKPVRARMDLTFESVGSIRDEKKQSPFESPDRTKLRYSEQGFDLWRLAWAEYGDAGKWRLIAEANDIHNPLKCPAGTRLKIPPI